MHAIVPIFDELVLWIGSFLFDQKDFAHMFLRQRGFNQALDHFDTANVKNFREMFAGNKITYLSIVNFII